MLSKPITYSIELSLMEIETIRKLAALELAVKRMPGWRRPWVLQIKEKMKIDFSS